MDCMNRNCPQQVVGMAYVPWQRWGDLYEPGKALQCGTLFAVLNMPFIGCRRDRRR